MKLRRSICLSFLIQAPGPCVRSAITVAALGLLATGALAQNVWTRSGTNDWYGDVTNWSLGHFPQAGEDVVITNASVGVLLTNAAPAVGWLNSLMISNTATLIFSNWTTTLSATNVTIKTNAMLTCAGPFTDTNMSNRVSVACSDLTILAGGKINVSTKGYQGGNSTHAAGYGPGGGNSSGNGGSYGGYGGRAGGAATGTSYPVGAPFAPLFPGSGGGGSGGGGAGGGAVRIDATGKVTINGTITANGGSAGSAGGGSGGGIYITCARVAGTNGIVQANGDYGTAWSANGAGGRIALLYDSPSQSNEALPSIQFSVLPGTPAAVNSIQSDIGTVAFPDASLLAEPVNVSGQILLTTLSWAPSNLTVSNSWVRFPQDGFQLRVTNDVRIVKGSSLGRLELGGSVLTNFLSDGYSWNGYRYMAGTPPVLSVGGNLILTNGALLYVYSAPTNGIAPDYGSLVDVTGDMLLAPGCTVYAYSHWTNGASPFFRMRSLSVPTNASFNADAAGFGGRIAADGYGPGGGVQVSYYGLGGSYGGLAGGAAAGKTYGSSNAPALPGSAARGDGTYRDAFGGGLVRVESRGTIALDGTLTANGDNAMVGGHIGGGSGGAVYLWCKTFAGSTNGIIRANGGGGGGAGTSGGGGRIAVWRSRDLSSGSVSNAVAGGTGGGGPGGPGTIVWGLLPPPGTVFVIH